MGNLDSLSVEVVDTRSVIGYFDEARPSGTIFMILIIATMATGDTSAAEITCKIGPMTEEHSKCYYGGHPGECLWVPSKQNTGA